MIPFLIFLAGSFSEATAIFLIISPGARQVAMGSAFTGIADDITAMYYNPAGLAFSRDLSAGVMYAPWLPGLYEGMTHIYAGATAPVPISEGSLGFGYTYLKTGEAIGVDENGNEIGRWEAYDYALILSYGEKITKNLGMGISFKYIYSMLPPHDAMWIIIDRGEGKAQTVAWDWGMLYKTSIQGLSMGVSYQNLGSNGLRYVEDGSTAPIPAFARAGASFDATVLFSEELSDLVSDLNLAFDLVNDLVKKHKNWYSGGVEIGFKKRIFVRGGYFHDEEYKREGMTYGCGVTIRSFRIDIASDADIYNFPTSNWRAQATFSFSDIIAKYTKKK